jgi:hypothetical protein
MQDSLVLLLAWRSLLLRGSWQHAELVRGVRVLASSGSAACCHTAFCSADRHCCVRGIACSNHYNMHDACWNKSLPSAVVHFMQSSVLSGSRFNYPLHTCVHTWSSDAHLIYLSAVHCCRTHHPPTIPCTPSAYPNTI